MDWTITLGLIGTFVCASAFAGWRGARPSDPSRGPRLVPWRFIMVLAAAFALLVLVHAVNLLGVETGRR